MWRCLDYISYISSGQYGTVEYFARLPTPHGGVHDDRPNMLEIGA